MKLETISEFKLGKTIQGFFLCKEKKLKYTKSNNAYLDLVLIDKTGSINAKMWDLIDNFQDRFNIGDPVAVKGKVGEYNNITQLIVTQINLASKKQYEKYGYSKDLLVKYVDESISDLWIKINNKIDYMNLPYKELVETTFDYYKDKIEQIPLSIDMQYPVYGSYLKNLSDILDSAKSLIEHYPFLDKDLIFSGIMLYNIGKVKCINEDLLPNYSDEGQLLGHIVLSRDIVVDNAKKIKNFPKTILTNLEYIILFRQISKKNIIEDPQIPEAQFIYYLYELDRMMYLSYLNAN